MSEIEQPSWIAGFWRRLSAFVIDLIILALIGYVLGFFIADTLVQLGSWGRALGFVLAVGYFGIQESRLCNGQTPGKRMLNIAVVDAAGNSLPIAKSLLRAAVYALPVSLNNAQLPVEIGTLLAYLVMLIIFAGILSFGYFLIFNRATRQAPYDLLVGALVVKADLEPQPTAAIWRGHYAILLALILSVLLMLLLTARLWLPAVEQLAAVQQAVESEPEVLQAWVSTQFVQNNQTGRVTYVVINALIDNPMIDNPELAKKIATMAVFADASVADKHTILVQLTYGYDIGFSAFWRSKTFNYAPADL